MELTIYGATTICPSCVGMPSSKETYEWLIAAVGRKYPNHNITFTYIDINNPSTSEPYKSMTERIIEEDLFYPVVAAGSEVIAEGNPRLKDIYSFIEGTVS